MKILAVADEESPALWDYYIPGRLREYDLMISCGDLKADYLSFLVTMGRSPLLYVHGNHDGSYLFTFLKQGDVNCESSKGTLESSHFTLRSGAFVSFRFGGAGANNSNESNHDVYIELCRADGSVIARFYNDAEGKVNTRMNAYYYQYGGLEVECFFRVVDNSTANYGCVVLDDFAVNLEAAPEGFIPAIQ